MASPTASELRIIHAIVVENLGPDSRILKQLAELRFPSRQMTGTGFYVEFDPLPAPLKADAINTAISIDLPTKLPPPQDLAGFTLFIDDGFISSFEGYTFGDVAWPKEPLDDWLKFELPVKAGTRARS